MKLKLRVLFYKAKWDGHLLDDAISLWTGIFNWGTGPYSHAEIWIPDDEGEFEVGVGPDRDWYYGTCYTSTMRGDENGVVKRPAAQVLKHPERWDYIEIGVEDDRIINWMDISVENNPGYDIKCIISFFWPWRWHKSSKFICSEFCASALHCAGIGLKGICPSPRRLSRWLVDKGYQIQSLGA